MNPKDLHKIAKDEKEAWDMQDMQLGKPHGWIQWKGTQVCMDVYCKCGSRTHVDADFTYFLKCASCGTVYMTNGHIEFIELVEPPKDGLCIIETHLC